MGFSEAGMNDAGGDKIGRALSETDATARPSCVEIRDNVLIES